MRVNVYAEEMTDRVEIVSKSIDGQEFTGVRFYLYLPVGRPGSHVRGPFIHRVDAAGDVVDDDSSAITFWGKGDLRQILDVAREALDDHYEIQRRATGKEGTFSDE